MILNVFLNLCNGAISSLDSPSPFAPRLIIQVAFVAIYADYLRYTSVQHDSFTASDTEASKKGEE